MVPLASSFERMYFGGFSSKILTAFLMLLTTILVTTTTASANIDVPEDRWVCGATEWDRILSYQRANESCQNVGWGINNCCAVHDSCYVQDKSQEECDDPFCACLEEQARLAGNFECASALEGFCFIVRIFGGIAHANAKDKVNNTNVNLTEVVAATTTMTTTTSTTTPTPTTTTTTKSPKKKIFKLEPTEKECFTPEINNCITEFETCQSPNKFELHRCEERMCQCTRSTLRNQANPECLYPIEIACLIPDSAPLLDSDDEESLLSSKIIIFGFSATLFSTLIFLVLAIIPLSFAIWKLYRHVKKPSMPVSASRTPLCAATSEDSGLGCGSNDSLSSDDGVRLALYP